MDLRRVRARRRADLLRTTTTHPVIRTLEQRHNPSSQRSGCYAMHSARQSSPALRPESLATRPRVVRRRGAPQPARAAARDPFEQPLSPFVAGKVRECDSCLGRVRARRESRCDAVLATVPVTDTRAHSSLADRRHRATFHATPRPQLRSEPRGRLLHAAPARLACRSRKGQAPPPFACLANTLTPAPSGYRHRRGPVLSRDSGHPGRGGRPGG